MFVDETSHHIINAIHYHFAVKEGLLQDWRGLGRHLVSREGEMEMQLAHSE